MIGRRWRRWRGGAASVGLVVVAATAPLPAQRTGDAAASAPWRPDSQPVRWTQGDSGLLVRLAWRAIGDGVSWATLPVRASGEGTYTRLIVVRIDPSRGRLVLDAAMPTRRLPDGARRTVARWTIDTAPARARVAFNAGQFDDRLFGVAPFGWLVLDGRERQPPGYGPLSTAVVIDSSGAVELRAPAAFATPERGRRVVWAFQSYPTLLEGDGEVPLPLRPDGTGIDRTHRDARLAIGVARDGAVLVLLTRFDALGPALGSVPLGLTTPETAALMGALGCQRAVMLDGGTSAQLRLRDARGQVRRWPGWRRVPLGLLVLPR